MWSLVKLPFNFTPKNSELNIVQSAEDVTSAQRYSQGSISQKRKMLGVCPGRNVEVCITLYNSAHYTELSFL